MSKASEWSTRKIAADREDGAVEHTRPVLDLVYVDGTKPSTLVLRVVAAGNGRPSLQIGALIVAGDEAIRGARWILDTFGEGDVREATGMEA